MVLVSNEKVRISLDVICCYFFNICILVKKRGYVICICIIFVRYVRIIINDYRIIIDLGVCLMIL